MGLESQCMLTFTGTLFRRWGYPCTSPSLRLLGYSSYCEVPVRLMIRVTVERATPVLISEFASFCSQVVRHALGIYNRTCNTKRRLRGSYRYQQSRTGIIPLLPPRHAVMTSAHGDSDCLSTSSLSAVEKSSPRNLGQL